MEEFSCYYPRQISLSVCKMLEVILWFS